MSDRTLVIILEATDGELVRRWLGEGRLPALASLVERGSWRSIDSAGEFIQEATLASALTGVTAGTHGAYGWRVQTPGSPAHDRVRMDEGTWSKAFWEIAEELAPDRRILLLDVTYGRLATGQRRTEVRGWGMRVARSPVSHPPGLWEELAERYPPHPPWLNREYERSPREKRRYLETLLEMSERRGDMAIELLDRAPWDLAALNFTEPHYGGHAFYHQERPDAAGYDPDEAMAAEHPLRQVLEAVDRQLGRLVAAAGESTDVLVVSSMGMRINECSRDLLGDVLVGLGFQVPAPGRGRGGRLAALQAVGRSVLPRSLRLRLAGLARARSVLSAADAAWGEAIDWQRSRAVSDSEPGENWIRINRADDGGPVAPEEVEPLVESIRRELMLLENAETGEPAIAAIIPATEMVTGPQIGLLPDLLVSWRPEVRVREVVHPRLGRIVDTGIVPRAEHSSRGFLAAAGPRIARSAAGAEPEPTAEWDVAATMLHLLGSPLPDGLDGRIPGDLLARGEPRRVSHPIATRPDALL